MGREPRARTAHECHRRYGLLIGKRFGVGDSGVAVDGRVEVDVAASLGLFLPSSDLARLSAVLAVDPPAAAVGDSADFFHVDVDHVTGPAGEDFLRFVVGVAVGVDEPSLAETE
ncbi:hypothetical protein J7I98_26955 [Streptomyces sp. ISL-98]|nr:hypothetical protein [Streptomyces sp. ISL-98]